MSDYRSIRENPRDYRKPKESHHECNDFYALRNRETGGWYVEEDAWSPRVWASLGFAKSAREDIDPRYREQWEVVSLRGSRPEPLIA